MGKTFNIAAFDPSGELVGSVVRETDQLSPKWIKIANDFLIENGNSFKASLNEPLSHLATQFTSDDGIALVSIYMHNVLTSSIVLLRGPISQADDSVLKLFVHSLRKVELVKASATREEPFDAVFSQLARPLMVVVPWGDQRLSLEDKELAQDWSLHLSAAFFAAPSTPTAT